MEKELLVNRGKGFLLKRGRLALSRDGLEYTAVRRGTLPMIRDFYPMMDMRGVDIGLSMVGVVYGILGVAAFVAAYAAGSWLLFFIGGALLIVGRANETLIFIDGRRGRTKWTSSNWRDAAAFKRETQRMLIAWRRNHPLCEYRGL